MVLISPHVEVRQGKGADCVPQILARRHGRHRHSLVGWLVSSADSAPVRKVVGAIVAVVVITAAGFAVHRRIEQLIDALEEL